MAVVNPSVLRVFNPDAQNLYTISYPYLDTHQYAITDVSTSDPAVVSFGSATTVISATGTVGTIAGTGPYTAKITGMSTTNGLEVGSIITATDGVGSLGDGTVHVTSIVGNTSVTIITEGGSTPVAGSITDVSVNTPSKLPVGLVEGQAIAITGVGGMTQLKTAGENSSNKFYVSIADDVSVRLYSDSGLATSVDSSAFTAATPNTGNVQTFSVPQFNTVGSSAFILFNSTTNGFGTDINLDATGFIVLTGGTNTYELVATADINIPGATYQWWDDTNQQTIGFPAAVGSPLIALFKNDSACFIGLRITAPEGTTFQYPAQVTNAQAVVNVISGFVS